MDTYYGSIDLTKLGQIVRQHPELIKSVNMKDGTTHKFLNINIYPKQQPDQYGGVAYIKAACKRENQKEGLSYYLSDLKISQHQGGGDSTAIPPQQGQSAEDDYPF